MNAPCALKNYLYSAGGDYWVEGNVRGLNGNGKEEKKKYNKD